MRDPQKVLFREPNLNGWAMGGSYGSPDLLTITKSYSQFVRHVYEVKSSTADLLKDLRASKWTRYLPMCDRLTFAVEEGIDFDQHLRPLPVGIMVHRKKNDTWRTVRAAPPNMKSEPWPEPIWMALLFGRMGQRSDSRLDRMEYERMIFIQGELAHLRHTADGSLAKRAHDLNSQQSDLERREQKFEQKQRATEAELYEQALQKLSRRLGTFCYSPKNEEDVLGRWMRQILDGAFAAARDKLLEPDQGTDVEGTRS